ncbi:UPF0193 protein EVG1 homolog [Prorops nasuta]|uniref:UPF0193 protein EVG1 homolog n=1 Tax=Prorops nasuta TaxID=863751 RepID=UPI0034CE6D9E
MERRYQRVEAGIGAFHNPARTVYSDETKNLVKLLMEESKLSMMLRKSIQDAVDKGESLPTPSERSKSAVQKSCNNNDSIFPSNFWKKRSQETIISSGAYERDQFRRTTPLINKDKQKRHLACMMAYGKEIPETPHGPRILHKKRREAKLPENLDPMKDLIGGIRERLEFLKDMESLGLGKKYQPIIQQEIAHKIRMIEAVSNKNVPEDIEKELSTLKYERPMAKPYPLGDLE